MPDNDDNTPTTPGHPLRVVDPASTEGAPDLNTTNPHTDPTETGTADSETRLDRPDWPRWANNALHQLDTGARRVVRFVDADPEGAARLVGAAIGTVAIGVVVVVLLGQVMRWAVDGDPLGDLVGILPAYELATDPIMGWLALHTAGTGISSHTAAWTWGITGIVVWFFACGHQLGAQLVAWPAYGAASVAMAWLGTIVPAHRPIAAGVVAIAWAALSLFALNRRPRPRPRYVINRDQEAA